MALHPTFPYAIGDSRLTQRSSDSDHLAQMIEQLLFVRPGEHVNRPSFGYDLPRLTFATRTNELTTAVKALLQGALRQSVGHLIQVLSVDVKIDEAEVDVTVRLVDIQTQTTQAVRLKH